MLCVIKALGLQVKIQVVSTLNILLLGTSLAYYIAIVQGVGINGLWYGEFFGFFANLIVYSYIVFGADWHTISQRCMEEQETECQNIDDMMGEIDSASLISDNFDEDFKG